MTIYCDIMKTIGISYGINPLNSPIVKKIRRYSCRRKMIADFVKCTLTFINWKNGIFLETGNYQKLILYK